MTDDVFAADKVLRHLDAIRQYRDTGVTPPVLVELDMTNACDHRCPCCVGGRTVGATLRADEAIDWIGQMSAYGVKAITFTGGGEPLMAAGTIEAVEAASRMGLQVGLITNGGRLDQRSAARLLVCCTWIRVSLDADSPAAHHRTHGTEPEEFYRVVENVLAAARIKRQIGSDCTLGIGYLTGPDTIPWMPAAARFWAGSGVDYLQFRPFHESPQPVPAEVLAACEACQREDYRVLIQKWKYGADRRQFAYCHAAHFLGVVQADGNMPLCCHLRGQEQFYIGNLHEESFRSIWEGQRKRDVLASVDATKCLRTCRLEQHNRLLHAILTPMAHEAFL